MTVDVILLALTWYRTWVTRPWTSETSNGTPRSRMVSHVLFNDGESASSYSVPHRHSLYSDFGAGTVYFL